MHKYLWILSASSPSQNPLLPLPRPLCSPSLFLHSLCSRPTWSPFLTLFTIIEKLFAALCELLPSPLRAATSSTFYQHSKIKINIALWIQTHAYMYACSYGCVYAWPDTFLRTCVCDKAAQIYCALFFPVLLLLLFLLFLVYNLSLFTVSATRQNGKIRIWLI